MLYTAYLKNGTVYVPTVGRRGGVYEDIDPVAVVPVTDGQGLHRAFREAIARENIPLAPVKGKWPPPVLLKYAGVKSWSAFAHGASTWNIRQNESKYQINSHRVHPDGYWEQDPNQKIDFPPGTPVDAVIERMIAILQDAARRQTNEAT